MQWSDWSDLLLCMWIKKNWTWFKKNKFCPAKLRATPASALHPSLYPWDLMNILFCFNLPHNLHTPQALFARSALQQTQIKAETQIYYLLVKEFTGFLLDGVEILDLPGWETHDESYALCCGRVLVEVVTRGLRPLVDPLVYGLTEVHSLQTTARRQSFSDIQRTKTTNITLLCPFLCFCPSFFFFFWQSNHHTLKCFHGSCSGAWFERFSHQGLPSQRRSKVSVQGRCVHRQSPTTERTR